MINMNNNDFWDYYYDLFRENPLENESDEIIMIYDEEMKKLTPQSNFILIPLFKYLEIFDLFIDNLKFTCSFSLWNLLKEIFYFDEEKLLGKFEYLNYYEIKKRTPKVLISIIHQNDETITEKSITNILNLYRGKNSRKLILIVDKENFKTLNGDKELKESIKGFPINFNSLFNYVLNIYLNRLSDYIECFSLNPGFSNIGLYQIVYIHNQIEKKKKNNIKKIILNLKKSYYSPLWYYFSREILDIADIENTKERNIKISNIFKFLNIDTKYFSEHEKEKFFDILKYAKKNNLFEKQIRDSLSLGTFKSNKKEIEFEIKRMKDIITIFSQEYHPTYKNFIFYLKKYIETLQNDKK